MKGKVMPTPHELILQFITGVQQPGTKVRMFNNTANVERGDEKRRSQTAW